MILLEESDPSFLVQLQFRPWSLRTAWDTPANRAILNEIREPYAVLVWNLLTWAISEASGARSQAEAGELHRQRVRLYLLREIQVYRPGKNGIIQSRVRERKA